MWAAQRSSSVLYCGLNVCTCDVNVDIYTVTLESSGVRDAGNGAELASSSCRFLLMKEIQM